MKKTNKRALIIAAMFTLIAGCVFVSCSESDPEQCLCSTEAKGTLEFKYSDETLVGCINIHKLDENSNVYKENKALLEYYKGSYYIDTNISGKTYYYFICNPEKITGWTDTTFYDITGTVHSTTNVLLQDSYTGNNSFNEFSVKSAAVRTFETEGEDGEGGK